MSRQPGSYGKVVRKTNRDERYRALAADDRRFLKDLWTCEQAEGSPGYFRLTVMDIVSDSEMVDLETVNPTVLVTVIETVKQRLHRLSGMGWFEYDWETKMIFLPKWHQFDSPYNQNVVIGMLTRALDFPESPLFLKWYKSFQQFLTTFRPELKQLLRERLEQRLLNGHELLNLNQSPNLNPNQKEGMASPSAPPASAPPASAPPASAPPASALRAGEESKRVPESDVGNTDAARKLETHPLGGVQTETTNFPHTVGGIEYEQRIVALTTYLMDHCKIGTNGSRTPGVIAEFRAVAGRFEKILHDQKQVLTPDELIAAAKVAYVRAEKLEHLQRFTSVLAKPAEAAQVQTIVSKARNVVGRQKK